MTPIAEMLNAAPGISLTPEITNALATSRLYDMANAMLQYQCSTCKGAFDRRGGPQARRREHPRRGDHPADRSRHRCRRLAGPLATHRAGCVIDPHGARNPSPVARPRRSRRDACSPRGSAG